MQNVFEPCEFWSKGFEPHLNFLEMPVATYDGMEQQWRNRLFILVQFDVSIEKYNPEVQVLVS